MISPTRRSFLKVSAFAAGAISAGTMRAKPLGLPIGLQTYTVRNEMEKDLAGTLKLIAGMGYEAIEVGDPFYGSKPAELRDMLRSLGLTSPSGFYDFPKENSAWSRSIEKAKTLDVQYMITSAPEDWTKSLDGWRRAADRFNELGAECKKAGMFLTYHNHNFEYKVFDGVVAYDELLRRTDPASVKMEMDCFWTTFAGKDPVKYFNEHPGRFALLHIKGLKKGFPPSTDWPKGNPFTEVGTGIIDYVRIFRAAPKGGLKHYYVEQDNWDRPALESARMSCEYLKKLKV